MYNRNFNKSYDPNILKIIVNGEPIKYNQNIYNCYGCVNSNININTQRLYGPNIVNVNTNTPQVTSRVHPSDPLRYR